MKHLALRRLTIFAVLLPLTLSAHLTAQAPVSLGDEILVSSSDAVQNRDNPDVAVDAVGNFVVVWKSDVSVGDDTDGDSIQGRKFACDGIPIGDDFQVNTFTTDSQGSPQIAMGTAGDFSVFWGQANPLMFRARNFTSGGAPVGDDFEISVTGSPQMTRDSFGNFIFSNDGNDGDAIGITAQRFASDGSPLGDAFQVNTYTTGAQTQSRISAHASGFNIVWYSNPPGDVRLQRFDSGGLPLGSEITASDAAGPIFAAVRDVATTDSGELVVTWNDPFAAESPLRARRFTSDGAPVGSSFLVAENLSSGPFYDTAIDDAGNFQAVWDDTTVPGEWKIEGGFVGADGTSSGSFVIADTTLPYELVGVPSNDANAEGHFVVVWQNFIATGLQHVRAEIYTTNSHFGDRIWFDADFDGVQDPDEIGVGGIRINAVDGVGDLKHSVVSDAVGDWGVFSPNDTTLEFELPSIYEWTLQDQGGDEALDSDVDPLTGTAAAGVAVCGDPEDATIDAGVTNGIGEFAFQDLDADGVQDPAEPGLAGVLVGLIDAGTGLPVTNLFVTDDDGRYHFNYVLPGDYYLEFTPPAGYEFTQQDQGGDDALDSDVDPSTGRTATFTLGVLDTTRDAGFVMENPITQVGNRVWLDDGDGLQAGGEPGVEGVTVNLYDAGDNFISSTQTNASGTYLFSADPGDYYVEVVLPADNAFAPRDQGGDDAVDSDVFAASGTTAVFTLGLGVSDFSRDAGIEPATIGNRVWFDGNGDGRQQPDEAGAANVIVRLLDDADMVVASTTTDADGVYGFLGVASGDYRVEVVPPNGVSFTTQNVGGDDLIDSDVDPSTGRTAIFSYSAGGASRSHDAGLATLFSDGFESGDLSAWSSVVP